MYNNNRPNGTELIKMAKQFFWPIAPRQTVWFSATKEQTVPRRSLSLGGPSVVPLHATRQFLGGPSVVLGGPSVSAVPQPCRCIRDQTVPRRSLNCARRSVSRATARPDCSSAVRQSCRCILPVERLKFKDAKMLKLYFGHNSAANCLI